MGDTITDCVFQCQLLSTYFCCNIINDHLKDICTGHMQKKKKKKKKNSMMIVTLFMAIEVTEIQAKCTSI